MRINKYLARLGLCSRRQADAWVESGRLTLNGVTAKLGDTVEDGAVVLLDGKPLEAAAPLKRILIAYNKPEGVESTQDARNPRNVDAHIKFDGPRIFLIGRLDIGSEGLLLMTNDGDLVNPILRSQFNHEKEYVVVYDTSISEQQIHDLSMGVDIDDERGLTKPCQVERMGGNRVKIILTEGRNRQIRRMAEAVGLRVVRLKRIRVMNVQLGELARGAWRYLSAEEERTLLSQLDIKAGNTPREKAKSTPSLEEALSDFEE
ncbi:MAG: pseudouridine synthase [Bdellovibrionota bacterium]